MKKFISLLIVSIFCCFSVSFLTGCSGGELNKISKGLTSYAISADFDDESKQISATERIVFYNNTGNELEYICLHLYPRAFREGAVVKPYTTLTAATCFPNGVNFGDLVVLKVRVNADTKEFELIGEDEDILKINFGFKLSQKKSVEIEIVFNLIIPNSTHRFGWFEDNVNLGNWYPVVCVYENGEFDMSPYYATGDPFYSELANYEIELKFNSKYTLASTGECEINDDGEKKIAKIKAKAVRDFAMCLSSSSNVSVQNIGNISVFYMCDKQDEKADK